MPQDFSGQNLRGRNFKGQDLTGANFSYADIRGANFTNAILRGANFTGVRAGLEPSQVKALLIASISFIIIGSLLLSVLLAILIDPDLLRKFLRQDRNHLLLPLTFIITTNLLYYGLKISLWLEKIRFCLRKPKFKLSTLSRVLLISTTLSFFLIVFKSGLLRINIERFSALTIVGCFIIFMSFSENYTIGIGILRNIVIGKAGTIFHNADLTDANFTQASLTDAVFRKAKIDRVYWFMSWGLYHADLIGTYFEISGNTLNTRLINLVVTGDGRNQNFNYLKTLKTVNLKKANLIGASFIEADLSQANLQETNLSRANLVRTRLDQADLRGACLTGAFIQDWNIKTTTRFEGVKCEYVYMRLPSPEDPDPFRKPDNRDEVFKDGDFADFIKPIVDTLDLYHNQGVDPRAIAIAFKNLAEDNPEAELEIVAMEKRGKDKFLLRARTAPGIDKSELSQAYFEDYNQLKALPVNHPLKLLLDEKDNRIRSLENMVETALRQPKFYTENYHHRGDVMPENSGVNINAGGNIGDISGLVGGDVSGVVNLGEISGQVTNTINQLPASSQPDEPGIKELLEQLQRAIESAEELKPEDKAEALKQVQALAEAGKDPAEAEKKNIAKSAIRWFKGMLTELAEPSAIAQLCKKLLPHIATIFGL